MNIQPGTPARYVTIPEIDPERISRIDCYDIPSGVQVFKWHAGWAAGTRPTDSYIVQNTTSAELLAKLQQPWVIHTWGCGGRAWLFSPAPVRTAEQTRSLRNRLSRHPDPRITNFYALDLIFDL